MKCFYLLLVVALTSSCLSDEPPHFTNRDSGKHIHLDFPLTENFHELRATADLNDRNYDLRMTIIFRNENQDYPILDKNTFIEGRITINFLECDKSLDVSIPKNYYITHLPPSIKEQSGCAGKGQSKVEINVKGISIIESSAFRNRNFKALNIYPQPQSSSAVAPYLRVSLTAKPYID